MGGIREAAVSQKTNRFMFPQHLQLGGEGRRAKKVVTIRCGNSRERSKRSDLGVQSVEG